jgi:hypothetical protein
VKTGVKTLLMKRAFYATVLRMDEVRKYFAIVGFDIF